MRVQLLISWRISVKDTSLLFFFFPLCCFIATEKLSACKLRDWNFIVYVFIHCEAGITDFTRSFKQMSEYSIDWNVNTGWCRAPQLEVQQLSSLSFIVSQTSKKCFSLNCWLSCSSLHQGLGILGNEKMRCWYRLYTLEQRAPFSLY